MVQTPGSYGHVNSLAEKSPLLFVMPNKIYQGTGEGGGQGNHNKWVLYSKTLKNIKAPHTPLKLFRTFNVTKRLWLSSKISQPSQCPFFHIAYVFIFLETHSQEKLSERCTSNSCVYRSNNTSQDCLGNSHASTTEAIQRKVSLKHLWETTYISTSR